MGGRSTDWVDRAMDAPSAYLGKRHRILFHDQATVLAMMALGGPQAGARAATHIATDKAVSAAKKNIIQGLMSQGFTRQQAELMVNNINI